MLRVEGILSTLVNTNFMPLVLKVKQARIFLNSRKKVQKAKMKLSLQTLISIIVNNPMTTFLEQKIVKEAKVIEEVQ